MSSKKSRLNQIINALCEGKSDEYQTFVEKIFCFEVTSSTNFSFYNDRNKIFNPNVYIDIKRFIKKKVKSWLSNLVERVFLLDIQSLLLLAKC